MPQIGDIKKGTEVGFISQNRVIWIACEDCGKEFWVRVLWGKPRSKRCVACHQKTPEMRAAHSRGIRGERNCHWKGGRHVNKNGYVSVWIDPDDFFYPMARKAQNQVFEHRLVVAKALGRCLYPWEIVHHKGDKYPTGSIEDKGDNRYPENLELISHSKYHVADGVTQAYIHKLERKIKDLETEINALKYSSG